MDTCWIPREIREGPLIPLATKAIIPRRAAYQNAPVTQIPPAPSLLSPSPTFSTNRCGVDPTRFPIADAMRTRRVPDTNPAE